jgi:hydroxypyruvate isomerase
MLSLNSGPSDLSAGDSDLAALPGHEQEARAAIDDSYRLCLINRLKKVHILAGLAKRVESRRLLHFEPSLCLQKGGGKRHRNLL